MAEKDKQVHPMEVTRVKANTDVESAGVQSEELRLKKRMKILAYVTAFVVFITAVILTFALTVMHVKNPKFRLASIEVENINFSSSSIHPSFSMRFDAGLAIKNMNFGNYKYENSTITSAYRGTKVGEALVSEGRANTRSTKEIELSVDVTLRNVSSNSILASDINTGILTLTSHGRLHGEVHLLKVFKKKKSPQMKCTININLVNKNIQDRTIRNWILQEGFVSFHIIFYTITTYLYTS